MTNLQNSLLQTLARPNRYVGGGHFKGAPLKKKSAEEEEALPTPAAQRPCLETMEGGRDRVSGTLCAKGRVLHTAYRRSDSVLDTFRAKSSVWDMFTPAGTVKRGTGGQDLEFLRRQLQEKRSAVSSLTKKVDALTSNSACAAGEGSNDIWSDVVSHDICPTDDSAFTNHVACQRL